MNTIYHKIINVNTHNIEIKAKVLKYSVMYHGFFCGEAKLKLLEGKNKGKKITLQTVEHHKKGDIITILESTIGV